MESLWMTLGRGTDGVRARGIELAQRTRTKSAGLLARAEHRATSLQARLSSRRESLNGKPIERAERRVLLAIEHVLDRMGLGLRAQIRRLSPGPSLGAEARTRTKKRIRVAVRDVPVTAAVRPSAPRKAAARASKRWVSEPIDIEALAGRPVKEILARVPELADADRKALLALERSTKKRKSVISALEKRPS